MSRISRLVLVIGFCCGVLADARYGRAAEFECVGGHEPPPSLPSEPDTSYGQCSSMFIKGPIERGDYQRFVAFYAPHYRIVETLFLHSPGGDAEEAMKLGRLVRKYLIAAYAPIGVPGPLQLLSAPARDLCEGPQCICASACALIWLGSVARDGTVGVHRPKITDPQFATLPLAQAKIAYTQTLQRVVRYLEEMEVPRPLIDTMVATGPGQIYWATNSDNLWHPPSFAEWISARCPSPNPLQSLLRCGPDLVRGLVHAERQSLPAP